MAARPTHVSSRIRTLVLTDKGRRALAFERAGIPLPASYSAWGAPDGDRCSLGHLRCAATLTRDGGCKACLTGAGMQAAAGRRRAAA